MYQAGDVEHSLTFPSPAELGGGDFATIDAFLAFQKNAVQGARQVVDRYANDYWNALDGARQQAFTDSTMDIPPISIPVSSWRRAWWLHTIGGQPRAPFETATNPSTAEQFRVALGDALAPVEPPDWPRRAFADWWYSFIEYCRMLIAAQVDTRIVQSRLAIAAIPLSRTANSGRKANKATQDRFALAEKKAMEIHRTLDKKFESIGSVCGACTRETGGCCTLTVPLIWREADFRLLALGSGSVPVPEKETAGACPFLGTIGCRLPADRRPFICRSFLCDRAEAALGDGLSLVRRELITLGNARSQLGG